MVEQTWHIVVSVQVRFLQKSEIQLLPSQISTKIQIFYSTSLNQFGLHLFLTRIVIQLCIFNWSLSKNMKYNSTSIEHILKFIFYSTCLNGLDIQLCHFKWGLPKNLKYDFLAVEYILKFRFNFQHA